MKTLLSVLFVMFAAGTTLAAPNSPPIPTMSCLKAGGFYGIFTSRQIGNQVELVITSGLPPFLTTQLGMPAAQALSYAFHFAPYHCQLGSVPRAFRCQGSIEARLEGQLTPRVFYVPFDAEMVVQPYGTGLKVDTTVKVAKTGRSAKTSISFEAGECEAR